MWKKWAMVGLINCKLIDNQLITENRFGLSQFYEYIAPYKI
jgi:hypothetical protein